MIMFVAFLLLAVRAVLPREAKAASQDSQNQQSQSVVDAARRCREQKKKAGRPPRVITNDDLDAGHIKRGQEGFNVDAPTVQQTEPPNASAVAAAETANHAATTVDNESISKTKESEEAAADDAEIARLKDLIASTQNDLNWQRRELLLNQNTVYSYAFYATTRVGKAELDSAQLQIDQKQQELESLRGPLADLEWRQWRGSQAGRTENALPAEAYRSVPPSALVLPQR
jgi:TATA-binding protein-associated factor Taf7